MTLPRFRTAGPDDAGTVALLHADSWRRHYRGAYADSFLDGDVFTDRRTVWTARLAAPAGTLTLLAEDGDGPAGFVHVVFDTDERWGSLVDNLHVADARRRTGIGRALLTNAAHAAAARAVHPSLYLWVLEQNTAAQHFYRAAGAVRAGTAPVPPPGGQPANLAGAPRKHRMVWPDAALLDFADAR